MDEGFALDGILNYVGQTVTIYTASGGISGSGFTGVLAGISCNTVKLISSIGTAPACSIGSACDNRFRNNNNNNNRNNKNCNCDDHKDENNFCKNNFFGCVTEIPIDKIVCFVHNAI